MATADIDSPLASQRVELEAGHWTPAMGLVAAIVLAAALSITLVRDFDYLFGSPYPYGIDGYYYMAHIEPSMNGGVPDSAMPPLAFWILRGFAQLVSPVAAVKLAAMGCLTATALAAFGLIAASTRAPLAGALAACIILNGFMREELAIDFLKQSLGHFFLLLAMGILMLQKPRHVLGLGIALALAIAGAFLAHTLAGVLACLVAASYVATGLARRVVGRWTYPVAPVALTAVLWVLTALAPVALHVAPPEIQQTYGHWFQASPVLHAASLLDTLGDTSRRVPKNAILTVSLAAASAALVIHGVRHGNAHTGAVHLAAASIPAFALAYSPWLTPAVENPFGAELRLVCALSIPAALLIPAAIHFCMPAARFRTGLQAAAIGFLVALPSYWDGFVGPPSDYGMLHRSMIESAPLVPKDAVVITDYQRANMVRALWQRPALTYGDALPADRAAYAYRLGIFDGPTMERFDQIVRAEGTPRTPIRICGPWLLVPETLYRTARDKTQTDATPPDRPFDEEINREEMEDHE